jgi:hypothetical protein
MKRIYFFSVIICLALWSTSCVKDELFNGPATLSNITLSPAAPQSSDIPVITAKVMDLKGVTSVKVYYRTSSTGTFSNIDLTLSAEPFIYTGTIPAQARDTRVEYYIEVKNNGGFTTLYPANAPSQLASYTVGASSLIKLHINEVFADGTKDVTDPDWVEIYNESEIPVDLSGYYFYDEGIRTSGGTKPKRVINTGTTVPAKSFIVFKTEYTAGEYPVEFGLSTSGDAVYLENTSGVLVASMDFLTISLSGKKSYGRQPDGSSNLVIFTTPTRGSSNN